MIVPSRAILLALFASAALLMLQSCDQERAPTPQAQSPSQAASSDRVITTFYPTAYFTQRIAGDLVKVHCPVPAGDDPAAWQPSAAQITEFQSAELIILNGARYEKWVSAASLPLSKVLDTSRPFETEFIRFKTTTHSHGAGGAHSHTGIDGHTWMDPILATRQAEQILSALVRRWPQHDAKFRAGFKSLAEDLAKLDTRLSSLADRLKSTQLVSNHPAYAYLARRYGLTISDISIDPGTELSDSEWQTVQRELAALPLRADTKAIMLFEALPPPQTVRRLADQGIRVVEFDPCESPLAPEATYLSVMNANLDRLEAAVATKLLPEKQAPAPSK